MKSDQTRWDGKFASRDDEPLPPDEFLVRNVERLREGRVLDVACGDGRNALFLAAHGFDVCGVDVSPVGLDRLQRFAGRRGLEITTKQLDLDQPASLVDLGHFDDVVVSHFKPSEEFWELAASLLVPDGVLAFFTFSTRQHEHYGFPRRYCVEPGEFVDAPPPGLRCVHHEAYGEPDRYREGYLFRRA